MSREFDELENTIDGALARQEKPTVRVPRPVLVPRLFGIVDQASGLWLVDYSYAYYCWGDKEGGVMQWTWASAHRFLIEHPDLEGSMVVAL